MVLIFLDQKEICQTMKSNLSETELDFLKKTLDEETDYDTCISKKDLFAKIKTTCQPDLFKIELYEFEKILTSLFKEHKFPGFNIKQGRSGGIYKVNKGLSDLIKKHNLSFKDLFDISNKDDDFEYLCKLIYENDESNLITYLNNRKISLEYIAYFKNASEQLQEALVNSWNRNLLIIENPTTKIQILAIKNDYYNLIQGPFSEDAQMFWANNKDYFYPKITHEEAIRKICKKIIMKKACS